MSKISPRGLEQLKKKKEKIKHDMERAWKRVGEAAGKECDWHDNAAYDQAQADHNLHKKRYLEICQKIREAEVVETGAGISPGDCLVLEIDGERGKYILGEERDGYTTVSSESVVGHALIGKEAGAEMEVEVGDAVLQVVIKEVAQSENYLKND